MKAAIAALFMSIVSFFHPAPQPLLTGVVDCGNVFPTSTNNYTSNCKVPSAWANSMESWQGIRTATDTVSINGRLSNLSSTVSNIGSSYITTFNGATGAITGVNSVNGATGTVAFTFISSFNNATGAITGVNSINGATGTVSFNVVNTFNGATGTVTGVSSINSATGTYSILAGNNITVTTSTNSVTIASTAGAGGNLSKLGRTATSKAATSTITVTSTVREYLEGYVSVPTGTTPGILLGLRFNNDSGSNYAATVNTLNSSPVGASGFSSQSQIQLDTLGQSSSSYSIYFRAFNSTSTMKQVDISLKRIDGTTPTGQTNYIISGVWANTTSSITEVDLVNASSTGTIATGTVVAVYGSAD